MSSVFQSSFLILGMAFIIAFGVILTAQEKPIKPPKDFQELMRSNTKIVAVDGQGGPATGSITDALVPGSENFEAIYKDAGALRENFAKIEAFFSAQKFGDALDYARAGSAAIADMQRWASEGVWNYGNKAVTDKVSLEIQRAQLSLATTCRNCHITHRVHVLTSPLSFEIR